MANVIGETIGRLLTLLGYDGTYFRPLTVDSDGHLQVDPQTIADVSELATHAKQDTMITALQLIDNLAGALGSVDTDDIQVDVKTSGLPSGAATETTLASILASQPSAHAYLTDTLAISQTQTLSGVTYWTTTPETVPVDEIWHLTGLCVSNSASTIGTLILDDYDATLLNIWGAWYGLAAVTWHTFALDCWLSSGKNPRLRFTGCTSGDLLHYTLNGAVYKVE